MDTTPPQLVSISFPETIDLGDGDAAVTFSASATDDVAVDRVIFWFRDDVAYSFSETSTASEWSLLTLGISDETGEGTVTRFFPAGHSANVGTAVIDRIVVEDVNGNSTTLQNAQLQDMGLPTSFEFTGNTEVDTTPPQLVSISFPETIDLGDGDAAVTFSASATDDVAVDRVIFWFRDDVAYSFSETSTASEWSLLTLGISDETGEGTVTRFFPAGHSANVGTAVIDRIVVEDVNGNSTTLQNAQLQDMGLPTSFEFTGNTEVDTTPPQLVSISFPETIDLGDGDAAVTFSASATDDVAVDRVIFWFRDDVAYSFSETSTASEWSLLTLGISDETGEGTVTRFFPAGHSANVGTAVIDRIVVEDVNGNSTTLQNAQLQDMGLPTSFEFTENGQAPDPDFQLEARLSGDLLSIDVLNVGPDVAATSFSAQLNFVVAGATLGNVRLGGNGALSSSSRRVDSDLSITLNGSLSAAVATDVPLVTIDFTVDDSFSLASSGMSLSIEGQPQTLVGLDQPISNAAPTGTVTISGTAEEDQVLTASNDLADEDGLGPIGYQWQRDGVDIAGATDETYTLGQDDVGAEITVVASYTDGQGTAESVASAATAAVANVNDLPTGTVTISGTAEEDQVLTASNDLADEDGLGPIGYQWQRDGVDIAGATDETYTLGQDDVGAEITVVASYTDGQGTAESVASAATAAVANVNDLPTGTVTISGTAEEDQVLTASNDLADEDGLGPIGYQWQRDGVDIAGATDETYTLGQDDVGAEITVVASYTDGQGTAESVASAATAAVANVNDLPTGTVTISGTAARGAVLTAETGSIADADGLGAFRFQWRADGTAIAGVTAATFTPGEAQLGTAISVSVSYTDGFGTQESLTSATTGAVAPGAERLGSPGPDALTGGGGDDTIAAGAGNDTIAGGDGDDEINTGIGFDLVEAGAGNDLVQGLNGFDTLNGGAGNDTLQGNFGNDELNGGDGDDELQGGVGFDLLRGDAGNDLLVARDGFDTLEGGTGNDTLQGNAGNDSLSGGDDDDHLIGGIGSDVMGGDAGDDLLEGQGGFDTLDGGAGNDTLQGNNSDDLLNGGEGDDLLEGGLANDVLNGDAGNDTLEGGNGFDLLNGGEGDDRLEGNAGNDTLDGGAGNDVLRGGLGADTFVFRVGSGNDTVLDLGNVDSVELEAALLGGGSPDAEDLRDISTLDADGFLLLDFGNGDTLTFTGITNTGAILDDVSFI